MLKTCLCRFARMLVAPAAGIVLLAGCQTAHVAQPLTITVGGNAPDQQLEFWGQLADRPVTSYDEAFHGLLLFTDSQDPANDYAGRVAALKSKGMLPAGFNRPADEAIDRGTLAVALAKALSIKGGLMMHLLGPTPRYAVRELTYLDVFPASSPNQTFSGLEFVGIITKAEDYQKAGAAPPSEAFPVNPAEAAGASTTQPAPRGDQAP